MISRQQHQSLANQQRERPLNGPGLYNGTLYLARRELRRTWRSYIWALVLAPLMGVAAAFMLGATPWHFGNAGAGLLFFILIAVLPRASNWHSGESVSAGWTTSSNGHISFLRGLPLTARQIAAARALVSVVSVIALCAAFFTPLYSLSAPLREELGASGHLFFAAFWVGCALAFEALGLLTELGFSRIAGMLVYAAAIFLSGAVAGGIIGSGATMVSAVSGLMRDYGALPALVALTVGCGALTLSWLATSARLRKKETR